MRLQASVREIDLVTRWGGEEFLIICRRLHRDAIFEVALRVAEDVRGQPYELPGEIALRKTCCVGFCLFPFTTDSVDLFHYEEAINLAEQTRRCTLRRTADAMRWWG